MNYRSLSHLSEISLVGFLLLIILFTCITSFQRGNAAKIAGGGPPTQPSTFASVEPTYSPTSVAVYTNITKPGEIGVPTPFPTAIVPDTTPPPVQETASALPATPLPTPKPSDPFGMYAIGEPAPRHIMLDSADSVVIGRVKEVRPARWSTPDGKRPANPHAPDNHYWIYRPVVLEVEQYVMNPQSASTLFIYKGGGTIGQDVIEAEPDLLNVRGGDRVLVMLLNPRLTLDGEPLYHYATSYTLTADGQATNILETLPLEQLLDEIKASNEARERQNQE